jgi:dipeptidyl aminopeptidase/acylaminoacyl peptidase
MKRCIEMILLLAPVVAAQTIPDNAPSLPPLINRELLFGSPSISGAQISPDGRFVTFLKPWSGTLNIWIKQTSEPFDAARPLTAELKHAVSSYLWSRDGKYVCYVKDDGESFNLYAVEPSAPVPDGASARPDRNLTGVKGALVQIYSAPKNDPDAIYVRINDRDRAWPDLYKVKISTGGKILIRENTDRIVSWILDSTGKLRLAIRTAENGNQEFLRVEPNAMVRFHSCSAYETCTPLRLDKEGKRLYMITNQDDGQNLSALALLDPQTDKSEIVESDPLRRVDFTTADFSDLTDNLVFTVYNDDRQRRYFKNKEFEADFKWLGTKLPGKEIGLSSVTRDEQIWLVNAYGDTEPGETWVFDRKAHTLALLFKTQESLPRTELATMEPVRYKSSDGLEIPAYLTLPQGVSARNLPTLVIPHGGPWARDVWGFNAMAQLFANRGYAVLMPNYRGSAGYGKKFLDAGNGEWGGKMQDDLTAGVKYLAGRGITDPKRVGILGSAYGGYAALAGVTFTPDLYRAAIAISASANLLDMLDPIPATRESLRKMMYTRTADPGTAEGVAWLKERSPLNHIANIKAALMLVHRDPSTPVSRAEADQIVSSLRDRNIPVEYLVPRDESRNAGTLNQMAILMAAEKFLARHLQGRSQDDGTPEVTKHLAEITVDPATVKLAKKKDELAVSELISDLKPGYYRYQIKLTVGDKEAPLTSTTLIEEKDGAWAATEITETPMGPSVDDAILEKATLTVRKRTLKQGEVNIDVDFSGDRAAGKISAKGQEHTISADLGGPLFAGAAGSLQSIGCLPLADGYTLSYRNFDLQSQKVKIVRLMVIGSESVTVPAGTFEAFKVQLSSAESPKDKAIVWIAKDTRQPVKMTAVSPAMAGATLTSELLSATKY